MIFMEQAARLLMIFGIMIFAVGAVMYLAGKHFPPGKMPGDIIVQKKDLTLYFPIATSILLSILLTLFFLLMQAFRK